MRKEIGEFELHIKKHLSHPFVAATTLQTEAMTTTATTTKATTTIATAASTTSTTTATAITTTDSTTAASANNDYDDEGSGQNAYDDEEADLIPDEEDTSLSSLSKTTEFPPFGSSETELDKLEKAVDDFHFEEGGKNGANDNDDF